MSRREDTFTEQSTAKRYICIKNLFLGAWNSRIGKEKFAKGMYKLASSVFPVVSLEARDTGELQLRVNIEPAALDSRVATTE
jgi:hypothetical protein